MAAEPPRGMKGLPERESLESLCWRFLLFSQATMLMIALGAHGFAPGLHRGAIRMSSIEVFANEAAAPIVKEQLLSTIGTDGLLLDPKSDDGLSVEEFVLELSANNPTAEPARSKLLNGKWEVRVASIICLPEKQPLSRQPCE